MPSNPAEIAATLSEAQRRAAQQRAAAEQLLEEARKLEERLSAEAEQARLASEHARIQELETSSSAAREAEQEAARHAESCADTLRTLARDRATAQSRRDELQGSLESARTELAEYQARIAEARRSVERLSAAHGEALMRFEELSHAEITARKDSSAADDVLRERRATRERLEAEFQAAQAQARPFSGETPTLDAVEQLHSLERRAGLNSEAARRVAERRAADEARRKGS